MKVEPSRRRTLLHRGQADPTSAGDAVEGDIAIAEGQAEEQADEYGYL